MPCRDDYAEAEYDRRRWAEVNAKIAREGKLLCDVCKWLEGTGQGVMLESHADLFAWWQEHKAEDAAREKAEAAVKEHEIQKAADAVRKAEWVLEELKRQRK